MMLLLRARKNVAHVQEKIQQSTETAYSIVKIELAWLIHTTIWEQIKLYDRYTQR